MEMNQVNYDETIFDEIIVEKIKQLNNLKKQVVDLDYKIKNNNFMKQDAVLINMNSFLKEKIIKIELNINLIVDWLQEYIDGINCLNENMITDNYSYLNENLQIKKINEIIENEL